MADYFMGFGSKLSLNIKQILKAGNICWNKIHFLAGAVSC